MTSEEQQNDMSMEDILSSIKDILANDSQSEETSQKVEPTPAPAQQVQPNEDEDVFDLSKSMIIEEPQASLVKSDSEENADFDLNLDKDDEPLFSPEDEEIPNFADLSSIENSEPEQSQTVVPEVSSDNDVDLLATTNDDDDIINLENDTQENDLSLNIDDILQSASETIANDAQIQKNSDENILPEENITSSIEANPEEAKEDIMALPEIDVTSEPIYEESFSDEVEYEPEILTPIQEKSEVEIEPEEVRTEMPTEEFIEEKTTEIETPSEKQDAADVSADIINNFAKMFAEQSQVHAEPQQEVPASVSGMGDGNKTIEQVVEGVIQGIVASSVNAEMTRNVDIVAYAQKEIHAQTRAWLEANLPAIVEAAVQKEIERVMAKVGK